MACTRMCNCIRQEDSLWSDLVCHDMVLLLGREDYPQYPPRTQPCPGVGGDRYIFCAAYANLKFAMRIARHEYTSNWELMRDGIQSLLVVSPYDDVDSTSTGVDSWSSPLTPVLTRALTRSWGRVEHALVRFPIGTYFDAVEAFGDIELSLSVVLEALRLVVLMPPLIHYVYRMRTSHRRNVQMTAGGDYMDVVLEFKRMLRRVRYLLRVGRKAMRYMKPRP